MLQSEDIANIALDFLGTSNIIGDMQEGTTEARVMARHYVTTMEQLLRSAHWNFSRKTANLTLLQDTTMNSPPPVGTGTPGMIPWTFEYAWPVDCLKARVVPLNNFPVVGGPNSNISLPNTEISTSNPALPFARIIPAPFVVANDAIPNLSGGITNWNQMPDFQNAQGQGITSQTVILTNVPQAQLIYTARITEPNQWDPLFQNAMSALLAAKCAMAIVPDKKMALELQKMTIGIARTAIEQARIADGNEGPQTTNREASWMRVRNTHNYWNNWSGAGGVGILWGAWDQCSFPDGSCF